MFNNIFIATSLYILLFVATLSFDFKQLTLFFETNNKIKVLGTEFRKEIEYAPVKLIIPTLNISADIDYLGVNSNGEMDIPKNTSDVGWFSLGPVPGAIGSSVIAGHLNGINGKAEFLTTSTK